MQTSIWYTGNDMQAEITGVRSSTMGSTSYLNSSTGLRVSIYDGLTTADTAVVSSRLMSYVSGTNGSYRATIQSTESGALVVADRGLAVYTLSHSGLNGKWYAMFRVENRGTS